MISFPHAKINIGLYVTARRDDGYHDIETIFFPVKWHDSLEIFPGERFTLQQYGNPVGGKAKSNLVYKAWKLANRKWSIPPVRCYLVKCIPQGAGLGGGSADASFMLKMLRDHFHPDIPFEELEPLSKQLGSDCAFFLYSRPAYACGRGDEITPVELDLAGYGIVIAYPGIHVSTAQAYSSIQPAPSSFDLRNISRLPVEKWREVIQNRFEELVFKQFPVIGEIKEKLYKMGALYASMSGSGSAVFGIYRAGQIPRSPAKKLGLPFHNVFVSQL